MNLYSLLAFGSAALSAALGVGAAIRASRSFARWMFVAGMVLLAVERACSGMMYRAATPGEMARWLMWRLAAAAFLPGIWLLFSLSYARGNASAFLRKWSWVLLGAFLVPVGTMFFSRGHLLVWPESGVDKSSVLFRLGTAGTVFYLAQLIVAVLVLTNLERTFRATAGTVRWRIKFTLMGVGLVFVVRLYNASQALLLRGVDPALDVLHSAALLLGCLLILRSLLRAGHFSLDVYPSQTVLQGSVTVLLAGVYLLIVGVFANLVVYWGGVSAFAIKTMVILALLVVLAVLLQSDRVRLLLRRVISRHFQRPMHDYRTVWHQFTEATAARVEQTEFCRAVVRLLADIFQSLSVTLWVVDDRREELTLAASTSVTEAYARETRPEAAGTAAILHYFRSHSEPVDFEEVRGEWAEALRRCHPDEFHKGGTRVCVPVVAGDEVLALIILGDRVSGLAFTMQDLDLLKSIGAQVASGLLTIRLSQRLLQTREHEAFQTMATFFVHDLKNAANTLNLMLQNLPAHFNDPAFREDALRGVGKTVAHINHLISRLSHLRHELKIAPVEADLNEVVTAALASAPAGNGFQIEQNLAPLPRVALDREQFGKVVTNLILNAREATNGQGRLRLATSPAGAWVVLTAEDNGCGMSLEFMARALFRPFQTTKKTGLGIGMFQSKMIVEAHGGRITVESTPGEGTTFRVFLPVKK